MKRSMILVAMWVVVGMAVPGFSQDKPATPAAAAAVSTSDMDALVAAANASEPKILADVDYRVAMLKIDDAAKASRLKALFLRHLTAVYAWHKDHGAKYDELVPAGLNMETGKKLNNYERMFIADSAIPASVHKDLMDGLKAELTQEQIWAVMDDYTEPQRKAGGKVAFTYSAYPGIIAMDKERPTLTEDEKTEIMKNLRAAAELSMELPTHGIAQNKLVSEVFDHYKKKNENYFDAHGRDWHAMYKAFVNKGKPGG